MTVRDIPTEGNDGKISRTVNFDRHSRTLIAAAQMAGDGLILTMLSYISFRFVIYPNHEAGYREYLPYFASTLGTTTIIVFYFALSGVYDIFEEFKSIEVL